MSPMSTPRSTKTGLKVAAVTAVAGAFVAVIASAANAIESEPPALTSTGTTSSSESGSTESGSTGSTSTSEGGDDAVYADIYVALDGPEGDRDAGPMVFSATNRLVGDGPELTGADLTSNPSEYYGDIVVDISLDPSTVTVTGGDEWDYFGDAYLSITLHGATFGSVTLVSDDLFQAEGDLPEGTGPAALGFAGPSGHGAAAPIMTALTPLPTLQSYGASGTVFTAHWAGTSWYGMSGGTQFSFVLGAAAPTASAGNPVFAG